MLMVCGCQNQNKIPPTRVSSEQIKQLSDNDIFAISQQACVENDKRAIIAPDYNFLSKRLSNLTQNLPQKINNIELNYQVYFDSEPNAWSTVNGLSLIHI